MAIRYTPDELKYLRDSPLVVKPPGLPPVDEWMGASAESIRNSTRNETTRKVDSNSITDQTNRRPVHTSKNSSNPEPIILGPRTTSFMSATSIRSGSKPFESTDREPPSRDVEPRFNFRGGRGGDGDTERTRDGRNNNTLRVRRGDGDQDNDGWSTVKPRKSFGTEGAERFNGRMGALDKQKDDRRFKDREDRDPKDRHERPQRGFDTFSRDKEGNHEQEVEQSNRKNGTGRGRNEPSWFKDSNDTAPAPRERISNGDRFVDRSRGWREKDREERGDREDRTHDRGERGDRRWDRGDRGDRNQRQEREPEWLSGPDTEPQPEEGRGQAITTQAQFQEWKDLMQGKNKQTAAKTPAAEEPAMAPESGGGFFGLEKQKVETPLAIQTGPDKFFGKWAATPSQEASPDSGVELKKEGAPKAKTIGKASRFFPVAAPQEAPPRRQTEPPPQMPPAPQGGLESLLASSQNSQSPQTQNPEQEAFAAMLRKLHLSSATPPTNAAMQPRPPPPEAQINNPISSPEPFQQYQQNRSERQEESRPSARTSQSAINDMMNNRQIAGSQPTMRPENLINELVGQRQNAISQSSNRLDQATSRSNADFLMGLMNSARAAPEPIRTESALLRMPPQQTPMDRNMDRQLQQQLMDQELQREAAAQRERSASQRQARPQPPPGFYDDPAIFQRGPPPHERQAGNPPQPTQILQRPPPPPGLDLGGWDRATQLPPPQHRMNQNIPPPPGLASAQGRAMPPHPQMFTPEFMSGVPLNMIPPQRMQPPPGFYNGGAPPPGFLPSGVGGFQGPEGMGFGGPFDGRGPPQGTFRRQ